MELIMKVYQLKIKNRIFKKTSWQIIKNPYDVHCKYHSKIFVFQVRCDGYLYNGGGYK